MYTFFQYFLVFFVFYNRGGGKENAVRVCICKIGCIYIYYMSKQKKIFS